MGGSTPPTNHMWFLPSRVMKSVYRRILFLYAAATLHYTALTSRRSITSPADDRGDQLVVSLTTYGHRLNDVYLVIESIAQQTLRPNRFILWLDEAECRERDLPAALQRHLQRGLEVRFCQNLQSYKKLIPTLAICPGDTIVTIDDDILYPKDMLEQLAAESEAFPNTVIAHRARRIKIHDGRLAPYCEWEYVISEDHPSSLTVPIGIGGVLYPPAIFHSDICLDSRFMNLAPNADDIWFKVMSLLGGAKCKKTSDSRKFNSRFVEIPGSQLGALHHANLFGKKNDAQIASVFDAYQVYDLLRYESQVEYSGVEFHGREETGE
tara:strand:+ start:797 stop:1765 length:969 start_codon:yes stop_codon:yes gene_type:complete